MILTSEDLRESKIFMYWTTVKRWASAAYGLTYSDVEMLMSLHCKKRFTNEGFSDSAMVFSWDKHRFGSLVKNGWIELYISKSAKKNKKNIYRPSRKTNDMVNKIYRILLGEEEIPVNRRSPFWKNRTYTDKVMQTSIGNMKRDYNEDRSVF